MIGGSACHDIDLTDVFDFFLGKPHIAQIDHTIMQNRIQRICYSFRLFMDLFDHKMLKSCFFCCFRIPFNDFRLFFHLIAIQIKERNLSFSDTGHLQVTDIVNISCIF